MILVFEPVEETVESNPDAQKLADFEEYRRNQLPRMLWAALEEVVHKEMEPVEERLRTQLMGVIRDCQDQVFSMYESKLDSNSDPFFPDDVSKREIFSLISTALSNNVISKQLLFRCFPSMCR